VGRIVLEAREILSKKGMGSGGERTDEPKKARGRSSKMKSLKALKITQKWLILGVMQTKWGEGEQTKGTRRQFCCSPNVVGGDCQGGAGKKKESNRGE